MLLILFIIFVLIASTAMVIGLINSKDYDIAAFVVIGFGIIASGVFIKSQNLTSTDLHYDEITYKDGIAIDSTVVFKERKIR